MATSIYKGYCTLITGDKKIQTDEVDSTKYEVIAELKLLKKTSYTFMILALEDTVGFQIIEEANTKANKCVNSRQAWIKIS